MTATALLDELHTKGVRLTRQGEQLAVDAPKGTLTDTLRQAIRQHKAALLDLLELFEERASLMEYDGRLPCTEAERLAWVCVLGWCACSKEVVGVRARNAHGLRTLETVWDGRIITG